MATSRRRFLRVAGLGGLAAGLAAPARAWGNRIRILGEAGGASGGERVFAVGQGSPELGRLLGEVRVDAAQGHGALRVFWLLGPPGPTLQVATLEEARTRGELRLTEREQASVPELIVENRGKIHVLLLAGEILLGGKQNRVLTEDLLLPPLSGPRPIGVYCVEQGRWAGRAKDFDARGSFAAPGLRAKVLEKAPQSRVWAEVDRYARRLQAASPTQSYQEIYEKGEVRQHLVEVERGIDHRAAPGALGAAVFVAETLAGLDLFFTPDLFAGEWPKLLRAHAIEAFRRPVVSGSDEPRLRARVEGLLEAASRAEGILRENAGVGRLFEFRAKDFRGTALVFEGRVVHAALL